MDTSSKRDGSKVQFPGSDVGTTTVQPPSDSRPYADSGATVHCSHDISSFVPGFIEYRERRVAEMADGAKVEACSQGKVRLEFDDAIIGLSGVLLIPSLGFNLVSIGKLASNGIESTFRRTDLLLRHEESDLISNLGKGSGETLYALYVRPSSPRTHDKFKISKEYTFFPSSAGTYKHARLSSRA